MTEGKRRLYCADCGREVTNEPSHECAEQRKANRRAQRRLKEGGSK